MNQLIVLRINYQHLNLLWTALITTLPLDLLFLKYGSPSGPFIPTPKTSLALSAICAGLIIAGLNRDRLLQSAVRLASFQTWFIKSAYAWIGLGIIAATFLIEIGLRIKGGGHIPELAIVGCLALGGIIFAVEIVRRKQRARSWHNSWSIVCEHLPQFFIGLTYGPILAARALSFFGTVAFFGTMVLDQGLPPKSPNSGLFWLPLSEPSLPSAWQISVQLLLMVASLISLWALKPSKSSPFLPCPRCRGVSNNRPGRALREGETEKLFCPACGRPLLVDILWN